MPENSPSFSLGPFGFLWGHPASGEIKLVRQIPPGIALSDSTEFESPGQHGFTFGPFPDSHKTGPWITAKWEPWRRYTPLSIPDLHRRFARQKPNERGVLNFSSRYGLLGHSPCLMGPDTHAPGGLSPINRLESVFNWQQEIGEMERLIQIWELINRKGAGKLGRYIRWRSLTHPEQQQGRPRLNVVWDDFSHPISEYRPGQFVSLALEDSPANPIPENWKLGDTIGPALLYLCMEINQRLKGHVDPLVMPLMHGDIMLWPDCLLSAMYILFAVEVSGKSRPPIMCRGCEKYFIPLHGAQRYCEEACLKRKWWRVNKSHQQDYRSEGDNNG